MTDVEELIAQFISEGRHDLEVPKLASSKSNMHFPFCPHAASHGSR
jgi:hypothetical protein